MTNKYYHAKLITVYNITVDKLHIYYVSTADILVHNEVAKAGVLTSQTPKNINKLSDSYLKKHGIDAHYLRNLLWEMLAEGTTNI